MKVNYFTVSDLKMICRRYNFNELEFSKRLIDEDCSGIAIKDGSNFYGYALKSGNTIKEIQVVNPKAMAALASFAKKAEGSVLEVEDKMMEIQLKPLVENGFKARLNNEDKWVCTPVINRDNISA